MVRFVSDEDRLRPAKKRKCGEHVKSLGPNEAESNRVFIRGDAMPGSLEKPVSVGRYI